MRLGWTPERETEFEQHRDDGLVPARVAVEHRSAYVLYGEQDELRAELAGRLRHEEIWPAVGDWVAVREGAGTRCERGRRLRDDRADADGLQAAAAGAVSGNGLGERRRSRDRP